MAVGIVKSFNASKGFGFITPADGGKDVHVLGTAMKAGSAAGLKQGVRVEYTTSEGPKGPSANDVCIVPLSAAVAHDAAVPTGTCCDVPKAEPAGVTVAAHVPKAEPAGVTVAAHVPPVEHAGVVVAAATDAPKDAKSS